MPSPTPASTPLNKDNRRHHKVPVALLGRFTEDGLDGGVLHVLDMSTAMWRPSTPTAEGYERAYYSIDLDSMSPRVVEDYLATEIEGPTAPILKSLAKSHNEPSKPEMRALASFLGMQVLRTDAFQKAVIEFDRGIADRVVQEMSTDAAFDEYERNHGVKFSPKIRDALRAAKLEHIGNSRAVHVMLQTFGQLEDDLHRLRWRVVTLPMGAPDLVCSDCPAMFVHLREDGKLRPIMGGWGRNDVGAMMPLSPRQLLLGSPELFAPVFDWMIEQNAVNEFNRAIAKAARWVYAREEVSAGIVLACPLPRPG